MMHCFSKWHKNAFTRIRPNGEPIATPSICLYIICLTLSMMKNDSYAAKVKSFIISLQSKFWIMLVSQNKSSIHMSITSFKGILVNKLSISKLTIKWGGQKLKTLSANENESCTKNSLDVRGEKKGTKNLAKSYVGVPIIDKIGWNLGQLLITGLWTFGLPYKIPGLEPKGYISLYSFSEILPSFSKRFIKSITFSSLFKRKLRCLSSSMIICCIFDHMLLDGHKAKDALFWYF